MSQETIERKIAKLREYVRVLEALKPDCLERIKADEFYRGSVLYYLYVMADSCVTLAEMIIKTKNLPKPQSYSDCIDILGQHGIIPDEFAYEFARIAGFRNFLAHDYEKIRYEDICSILASKLDDVKKYLGFIEASLGSSLPPNDSEVTPPSHTN